jgi:hypothetical protein
VQTFESDVPISGLWHSYCKMFADLLLLLGGGAMAILQGILAILSRQMGRLLNTAFGWATTLLFGKVPRKRQLYLSMVSAGSVVWLIVLVGIVFPAAGTFLLAFIPLPDWIDKTIVRMIMLGLAVFIPALVGIASIFLLDPADRPKGFIQKAKAIGKGYPYTVGLAVTLLLMLIVAPILKARNIFMRWDSTHVPIVVEPEDYSDTVAQVQRILRENGSPATIGKASWLLRWPTKVFTLFVGGPMDDLVADNLAVLRAANLEVILHPSDLVMSGREKEVTRAHSIVTEHLTFSKAYLTWSKEAQEMEDRLDRLFQRVHAGKVSREDATSAVNEIQRALTRLPVPYEEWEILFRERLLLEREILTKTNPCSAEHIAEMIPANIEPQTTGKPRFGLNLAAMAGLVLGIGVFIRNRGRTKFVLSDSLQTSISD